jgi:DNA repair ATPase RecN
MHSKSIEALSNRFINLAKKPKLAKSERDEARQLMVSLKQAGLSNEEISELSGGRWAPNSVKYYTKGIKVVHPTQCDSVVHLLQVLNSSNLTLADVEKTVTTLEHLKSLDIPPDDITDVLFAAESSSMDIADLVHQHKIFKESGLSPEKVSKFFDAEQYLEAIGLSPDWQVSLYEAIKKYGDPSKILEVITAYSSLTEIKKQVKSAEGELKEIKADKDEQDKLIEEGKEKLAALSASIEAYHKVIELGYDEQLLVDLPVLSEKYGGPKAVIQACKAFTNYKEIDDNVAEAKNKLADINSEIGRRSSEHSYLVTGIDMCVKLVKEHHFGIDSLEMLLSAAQKYGDPVRVLEAIVAYGKIQALLEEEDKQQGIVNASKQKIAQLDGEYQDGLKKLESLNAFALQVGNELSRVHPVAAESVFINQLLKIINDPYGADYGANINAVMILGRVVKDFVIKNEANFKHRVQIINGLGLLINDLGGVGDITE